MNDIINVVVTVNGDKHQMNKEDFKRWLLDGDAQDMTNNEKEIITPEKRKCPSCKFYNNYTERITSARYRFVCKRCNCEYIYNEKLKEDAEDIEHAVKEEKQ